jgi:hypothetical protein
MKRGLLATIAVLGWPIAAEAAPPRVRLAYAAPEGCPDEAAFVAAVAAQAHPFERAPRSAARVRSLEARIARADDAHTGVLRVREADGATSERDVRGATCQEVFSALALVAALTVDTGPPPPSPPPPEEPPPPLPAIPLRWTAATTLHAGAFFSMAPGASIGVAPELEIAPPFAGTPLVVRLGLVLAASPRAETPAGSAEFFWFAARLDVGLFALRRAWFSLRPTIGAGAGAVLGRGFAVAIPHEETRPWFDVAAGLRAHAALLPGFGLELAGGLLVPITRETWIFERPDAVIHATPPVGGYVTVGVRVVLRP